MRTELIVDAATLKEAAAKAPWAAVIIQVTGGWMAFESAVDYLTWGKQK